MFPSRLHASPHLSTRQYARIVRGWIREIGLDASAYGTQTLRRTKASLDVTILEHQLIRTDISPDHDWISEKFTATDICASSLWLVEGNTGKFPPRRSHAAHLLITIHQYLKTLWGFTAVQAIDLKSPVPAACDHLNYLSKTLKTKVTSSPITTKPTKSQSVLGLVQGHAKRHTTAPAKHSMTSPLPIYRSNFFIGIYCTCTLLQVPR